MLDVVKLEVYKILCISDAIFVKGTSIHDHEK